MTTRKKTPAEPPQKRLVTPAKAPTVEEGGHELEVRLDELHLSPSNPRKTIDPRALAELAGTIAAHGVLQSLLVRPRPEGGYEIVCGERRYRAAQMAERATVPIRVRDLSDREVLEIQTIENDQREDVPALEQADALRVLHEDHGVPVEELAARLGRDVGYVYRRLRLVGLVSEAREALADGRIGVGVAEVLARLSAEHQVDAIERLLRDQGHDDVPPTVREARELVLSRYYLRIVDAPFDALRADLAGAPACGLCPKRTGAQGALFADLTITPEDDSCTDPECWGAKTAASWAEQRAAAEARGRVVLEGEEAVKVFPYGSGYVSGGYYDLKTIASGWMARNLDLEEGASEETIAERLEAAGVPLVVAQAPDGSAHTVARYSDAVEKLEPTQHMSEEERTEAERERVARERDKAIKNDTHRRVVAALVEAVVDGGEALEQLEAAQPRGFWHVLAHTLLETIDTGAPSALAERRGLTIEEDGDADVDPVDRAVIEMLAPASASTALGVVVELLVSTWRGESAITRWLELFEIDEQPFREVAERAYDLEQKRAAKAAARKVSKAKGGAS